MSSETGSSGKISDTAKREQTELLFEGRHLSGVRRRMHSRYMKKKTVCKAGGFQKPKIQCLFEGWGLHQISRWEPGS